MPPPPKKLVLHIGAEKTGTTSIQDALFQSRDRLLGAGFLFPTSPGKKNHTRLITYAQDDDVIDNIRAHQLAAQGANLQQFRRWLEEGMEKECAADTGWHTLILSSELIHSRLITPNEIARLMELVKRFVDEIEIIFFARRQDLLALSRFSSALRSGYDDFDGIYTSVSSHHYINLPTGRTVDDLSDYYDYSRLLDRFKGYVADDGIKLEIYPERLSDYDSVAAFEKAAGIPSGLLIKSSQPHNSAASAEAQYVLARINRILRNHQSNGLRDKHTKAVRAQIEKEVTGTKRTAARDAAIAFCKRYSESNKLLQSCYLGGKGAPFSNDFSMYPETLDYEPMKQSLADTVTYYEKLANTPSETESVGGLVSRIMKLIGR